MAASETCSRCGEEVRWGLRDGREHYLHRLPADHEPIFGHIASPEEIAEIERQRNLPRTREVLRSRTLRGEKTSWIEIEHYTTASHEVAKMKAENRPEVEVDDDDDDDEGSIDIEPIEVLTTPMPIKGEFEVTCLDGTTRTAVVPGGTRTLLNLTKKLGWEVERLTYSRGPYLGSKGKSLGVSDCVVLVVGGPRVDGHRLRGVAFWRDGASKFAWRVTPTETENVGSRALSAWMKENPCDPQ